MCQPRCEYVQELGMARARGTRQSTDLRANRAMESRISDVRDSSIAYPYLISVLTLNSTKDRLGIIRRAKAPVIAPLPSEARSRAGRLRPDTVAPALEAVPRRIGNPLADGGSQPHAPSLALDSGMRTGNRSCARMPDMQFEYRTPKSGARVNPWKRMP